MNTPDTVESLRAQLAAKDAELKEAKEREAHSNQKLTGRAEKAEAQVVAIRNSAIEALMIAKSVMLVWGDKFAPGTCENFARHEKQFLDAAIATIGNAKLADRERLDAARNMTHFGAACKPR